MARLLPSDGLFEYSNPWHEVDIYVYVNVMRATCSAVMRAITSVWSKHAAKELMACPGQSGERLMTMLMQYAFSHMAQHHSAAGRQDLALHASG